MSRNRQQDANNNSAANRSVSVSISSFLSGGSEGGCFCRICHEGESGGAGGAGEALVRPCHCAGTAASVHKSCIERWLTVSNSETCEICKFPYMIEKRPRSFLEWLREPGNPRNQRHMLGDVICFLLLTPLASVSTWLCLMGILHYIQWQNTWEAVGLVSLTMFLVIIYLIWCFVSVRYHFNQWRRWRATHQQIAIITLEPAAGGKAGAGADTAVKCEGGGKPRDVEAAAARPAAPSSGDQHHTPTEVWERPLFVHVPHAGGGGVGCEAEDPLAAGREGLNAREWSGAGRRPRTTSTCSWSGSGSALLLVPQPQVSPHDNTLLQRLFPQEFDGTACQVCQARRQSPPSAPGAPPRGPAPTPTPTMPDLVQSATATAASGPGDASAAGDGDVFSGSPAATVLLMPPAAAATSPHSHTAATPANTNQTPRHITTPELSFIETAL